MNFLSGKRRGDGVESGGEIRVPLPAELRATAPESIVVGVRPEHLVPGETAGTPFRFKGATVETPGAHFPGAGGVGGGAGAGPVEGPPTPPPGAQLGFPALPGALHFFDTRA